MGRATVLLSDSSVALREEKAPTRSEYSGDGGEAEVGEGTPGVTHESPAAKLGSLYSLLSQLEPQE